jgi:uncharacterized protein GlcG (DUF336 family)
MKIPHRNRARNAQVVWLTLCLAVGSGGFAVAGSDSPPSELPYTVALKGAQAALGSCKALGYNVSVMVLDLDTWPRAVVRGDGGPGPTIEIAQHKASTVLKTGLSSHDFGMTLPEDQRQMPPKGYTGPFPAPGPIKSDPTLDPSGGGLPIVVAGKTIGAIGVSGAPGDNDEVCARSGVEAVASALSGKTAK